MRFENITTQIKDIEKNKIDFAHEIYLKEIELDNRPAYYEKLLFKNFIRWFDNNVIEALDKDYESYILLKNNKKLEEIKELYPSSYVTSLSSIIPHEDKETIFEYIRVQDYHTSLFRLLYRHMYNDKENFKIKEDNYEKGYIVFEVKPLTDSNSNFRNRCNNKNYVRVNKKVDLLLNKIENACKKYETYEKTGVITEDINIEENNEYKSFMSEQTKAEIELYSRFIEELDFFVLSRDIIYNTDKLYVFKNNEDRSNIKVHDMARITIEDVLEVSIKDTNISSILNIEKYIYPCWRIAYDHFYNQGMNYNVLEDNDKYIKIKSFL